MSSTEQVVMIDSDSDIECTGQRRVRLLKSNVQSRAVSTQRLSTLSYALRDSSDPYNVTTDVANIGIQYHRPHRGH